MRLKRLLQGLPLFSLAFTAALGPNIQLVQASTFVVPDDYPTIQAAINVARSMWGVPSSGHTVLVREGTYYESIVINMSNHYLRLNGEHAHTTIIDGANAGQPVVTMRDIYMYDFCGFYVTNSGNNAPGIYSYNGSASPITNNIVAGNHQGIVMQHAGGGRITGNSFLDNSIGMNLTASWELPPPTPWTYPCYVYHNNFMDNAQQVVVESGYTNYWDSGYPSGGNYWSDYSGVDIKNGARQDQPGSDGIGDTPYIIDANNRDNYPLMNPYISGDVNYDGIVNTSDLSAVSKTFGAEQDSLNWNVRADTNDDLIINVIDLFNLAKNYGKTEP